MKVYLEKTVLEAAQDRIKYVFDNFDSIIASISGGKDSEVVAHLALEEAHKRGRKIGLFFLDEEVVYQSTVDMVSYLMDFYPENTIRYWLQIPFHLTNSTSQVKRELDAWADEYQDLWMHERSDKNILSPFWNHETKFVGGEKEPVGLGFYSLLYNFQISFGNTAFLIGLRSQESPNRYRAVTKNAGYKDVLWSTKGRDGNCNFYPIYDWNVTDIWKYIGDNNLKYHKYYDFAYKKGVNPYNMRVSSLIHEKAFKSIQDLPEFEFETYEKLLQRIQGISFAQETAKDKKMMRVQKLPKRYKTWREYRDALLTTYPVAEDKKIFEKRFAKHLDNEYVYKQQCKQLVLSDIENSFPIKNKEDPKPAKIEYWRDRM